ncbi:Lrp/AsnC family transcriptional regulator [Magnetospirillum aberrantis]|uniref:siroheme decarboxylase n=1 Tax=Magnetospirillum aberrantis SpK TaxID=908842 RepID=A0A7C9V046_9PROT|nr:Lrp/AsnC family transcriptional regulator [Magnetospirillum aberrantis]NFV81013.1 Lrp/AsnC family transcriptional regulator [Magnetospirillum aberrantis SpK]
MDAIDRNIVNGLQGGFPLCPRPFAVAAQALKLDEEELITRLTRMVAEDVLSRFGPLYHSERLGGAMTLAAMAVPEADFDRVCAIVNNFPEVSQNYERDHTLNMWFVVSAERPERVGQVLDQIAQLTGLTVHDMPKRREFFIDLKLEA